MVCHHQPCKEEDGVGHFPTPVQDDEHDKNKIKVKIVKPVKNGEIFVIIYMVDCGIKCVRSEDN